MHWIFSQPLGARVFHWDIGVEALGDGTTDNNLALLPQHLHHPPFLLDQLIDAGGLAVEKISDGLLCGEVSNAWLIVEDRSV